MIPGYEQFVQLEDLLAKRGIKTEETRGVLVGNYLRTLGTALAT